MSQHINEVKKRIKSVSGALKVTSAMKLVSTVRMQKWKNKMIAHKAYSNEISKLTDILFSVDNIDEILLGEGIQKQNKKLYIIISSTLGLCGSYNNNVFEIADKILTKDDDIIVLGKKGLTHFTGNNIVSHDFDEYKTITDEDIITSLTRYVISCYRQGKYEEVHIIYTMYKNSLTFIASDFTLLPLGTTTSDNGYPPIIEPSKEELIEIMFPFYLETVIYSKLLESEVSEQSSRSNAMENASDNAREILDQLKTDFNKARQASITQEITEIVGAANAILED